MAAIPQKILNWLHGVLTSEYRDVSRTYNDVAQTLSHHPNFSLRTDVYTFENGASSLLLNIRGTLPVSFRGTTYAFPISIWVPREYPSTAPINFVTPTKDMAIRPGQYRSNILEFLNVIQDVFAREPPVIARQEKPQRQAPIPQRDSVPPPVPPLPPELGASDPRRSQSQSSTEQHAPPPPPKSFEARDPPYAYTRSPPPIPPHPQPSEYRYGPSQQDPTNGYARGPQPTPQRSPQRVGSLQSELRGPYPVDQDPRYQGRHLSLGPVGPMSPAVAPTQQRRPPPDRPHPQETRLQQGQPLSTSQPFQPPAANYSNPPHQAPYQPQQMLLQNQYQPYLPQRTEPLAEDLLTSPFETPLPPRPTNIPAPPIPPNPQKDALLSALSQTLTTQVQSTYNNTLSAIPPLKAQQAALSSTLHNIEQEITALNNLDSLLTSNEKILHQAMHNADAVLSDAKTRKIPDVDDVLVAPTVVARQLYEAVAEQRAIEDCRALLAKALDRGRIGGGVWARQTRSLAREEFLKKAIVRKIGRGMGLVGEGSGV